MRINHNLASLNTHRQLTSNTGAAGKSLEKLSSGFRINRAGDDAAGLAISEKMRGQIRGLDQASRNAQDSISLIQTAEGALSTTHNILQRMRELSVQSANDTSTDADRSQLQKEINQLKSEIDRVAYTTEFNTKKLLNGNLTATKQLQGTKSNSSQIDAADFAASAGTSTGGVSLTERGSVQTVTGTGYSDTGFSALGDNTKIVTGVNDRFSFSVNLDATATVSGLSGITLSGAVIAASTGAGYSRAEFAKAVQDAINNRLTASGLNVEKNQIMVSITSDNKLKFTTAQASTESNLSIFAASGNQNAISAFGFGGYQNTYESTIDLSAGFTSNNSGSNALFAISVGGRSGVNIQLQSGRVYSKADLIAEVQSKLNTAFGAGNLSITDKDNDGRLELTTNVKTGHFLIGGSGTTGGSGGHGIFGINTGSVGSGGIIGTGTTVKINGTNTVEGYSTGFNISAGVNDQLNLSLDGGSAVTLTLSAKLYGSKEALVTEVNNQIGSNAELSGKVQARLTSDNKIEFSSVKTGSTSAVTVSAPPAGDQSALGVLGFGPSVGIISGTLDISNGIRLSGNPSIDHYKINVVLGNKTATVNLLDEANIITNGLGGLSGTTTRDAIVKGLQNQLDKAFGVGALNVTTRVSGNTETLRINTITAAVKFSVASISGQSGAKQLFGSGASGILGEKMSAVLGATPTIVETTGTDAVDNTLATNTHLSNLTDKDGNNLGLTAGNVITFAGTQNGSEFKTSLTVTADSTIGDLLGAVRAVPAFNGASVALDISKGIINVTGKDGEKFDLSNLRFEAQKSATESTAVGNFNRTFGSFTVTQRAQDGATDASLSMQIGANQGQTVAVDINNVDANSLKITNIDVSTKDGAQSAISVVNNALESVSEERSKLGAIQNRLEYTISNLGTSSENLTASESRIRDVDMAKEMMEFTKNNILSQAAQAMLAQANQQPQGVLQLLR